VESICVTASLEEKDRLFQELKKSQTILERKMKRCQTELEESESSNKEKSENISRLELEIQREKVKNKKLQEKGSNTEPEAELPGDGVTVFGGRRAVRDLVGSKDVDAENYEADG